MMQQLLTTPVRAKRRRPSPHQRPRRVRLNVEAIEDRLCLSTLTVDFLDTGWYDATGLHTPSNTNYITGWSGTREVRSFYAFNVPTTTGPIIGAQLRVFNPANGYDSAQPTETFSLFNVATPVPTLLAGGTGLTAIFQDLGEGDSYGSQTVSMADNGNVVSVALNGNALAALNAARGQAFAIGGANTTIDFPPANERFSPLAGYPRNPGSSC